MHNALLMLFPDFKPGDWVLQNDGDGRGPYIKSWNRPEPQPTPEQIAAVAPAANTKAAALTKINAEEAENKIGQRFLRELVLQLGLQFGSITPAMLDYTVPLDTSSAEWKALSYGVRLCVLQERICTEQRTIITAAGG
jgi:hypothetical protein